MTSKDQKQREKILKGTQELIMSQGFTNTSTHQLVKHIRISKTTLYKHFSTKEELIKEAILSILNEIQNELNAIIKKENVLLLDKIQQFMYVVVGHVKDLRIDVINDIKQNAPEIYLAVIERQSQIIDHYALILFNEAVAQGIFRRDLDQRVVIDVIINSAKHLASPSYLQHSPHTFESIFQQIFKLVIEGNLSSFQREKLIK